jgi:hypothetical protein
MSRVLVPCHVKSTVALQVGDMRTSQGRPGVLVVDVTFPNIAPFEVSNPPYKRSRLLGGEYLVTWAFPRHLHSFYSVSCFCELGLFRSIYSLY